MLRTYYEKWTILLLLVLSCGCSLSLISDYDEQSLIQMEDLAEKVDRMYIHMSYTSTDSRTFKDFQDYYMDIEAGLNRLKFRQRNRSLNELTLKQVDIVIDTWHLDMGRHQKNNNINNFMIKRGRDTYHRLFGAMIRGESSKPQKN